MNSSSPRRRSAVVAFTLIALITASCSSSDGGSSTLDTVSNETTTPTETPESETSESETAEPSEDAAPDTVTESTDELSDSPIRIAISADSGGTDPVLGATGPPSNPMRGNVLEMLFRNGRGPAEPWLVEDYELSDDQLVYTMTLREDVKFHDGTPLDSAAVKWSLDRAADEQFDGFSTTLATGPIDSVDVVDDLTFTITVSEPTPDMEGRLGTIAAAILSPAGAESGPNSYESYIAPVGTGPYSFTERVPDERFVFDRFDEYWGGAPYFARQEWIVVPEAGTRESLILAGEADVAIAPPLADLEALESNPDVNVIQPEAARLISIAMNTQDPLFGDVRVREAINLAVDKQGIIDTILAGAADIADAVVGVPLAEDCPAPGPHPFDPDRARSLLEEAGASELSITLTTPSGRYLQDVESANAVAAFLREVGIDVEVEVVDTARFFEVLFRPIEEAAGQFLLTGSAPAYNDGGFALQSYVPAGHPPTGTGVSFLDVEAVNESYDAANALPAGAERRAAFCATGALIWDQIPALFLWNQRFPVISTPEITGISVEFDERLDVVEASAE